MSLWVKMPEDFGEVVDDLSPLEADHSKKSLYIITYDDQQRNFAAPPKYYGIFWSADGPAPVNNVAIGLWPEFDGYQGQLGEQFRNHRDEEDNINGEKTKEGEKYSGFACFGYGEKAISLDVDEVSVGNYKQFFQLYKKGLLKRALKLVNRYSDNFDELMKEWQKNPKDDECKRRICDIICGAENNTNEEGI